MYHTFVVELKILHHLEQGILHCWLPMTANKRKFVEHTQLTLLYRKDNYNTDLTVKHVMVSVTVQSTLLKQPIFDVHFQFCVIIFS
jgi:hypothetical protein